MSLFSKLFGSDNGAKKREEEERKKNLSKPSQGFLNKIRDQIDPNTEADKYRRQLQGKSSNYVSDVKGVGSVAKGFGKSLTEIGDSVLQGSRYGAGVITGNRDARDSAARQFRESAGQSLPGQMYKPFEDTLVNNFKYAQANIASARNGGPSPLSMGFITQSDPTIKAEVQKRGLSGNFTKDIIAPTAESTLNAVSLGQAGALGAGFKTALAEQGLKTAARQAAPGLVKTAGTNFAQGASTELYGDNPTLRGALTKGAVSAGAGTAGDILLAGAPAYLSTRRSTPVADLPQVPVRTPAPTPRIEPPVLRAEPIPNVSRPRVSSVIDPNDQNVMADLIDTQRGVYKPSPKRQLDLEFEAAAIAERANLPVAKDVKDMARIFEQRLQEDGFKAPKPRALALDAERTPVKTISNKNLKALANDPLEALKAEARKYKSAELTDGKTYIKDGYADPKDVLVVADAKKLQELGNKSRANFGAKDQVTRLDSGDKLSRFEDFYKNNNQIKAPALATRSDGSIAGFEGNHRLRVLSDKNNGKVVVSVSPESIDALKKQGVVTDLYNQATRATRPKPRAMALEVGQPEVSARLPQIPDGYKLADDGNTILRANGQEATVGEIQRAIQDPRLTAMEDAINAGGGPRSLRTDALPESTKPLGVKTIPNSELAALPDLPNANVKRTGFTQTGAKSQELSTDLKKQLRSEKRTYEGVVNQDQLTNSEKLLKSKPTSSVLSDLDKRLDTKLGTIDNQTVSDTIALIKRLDSEAGDESLRQATALTNTLADHLTAAGQTVQAASLINRRTPDGILFTQRQKLGKLGIEPTPEVQAAMRQARDAIEATPVGSAARDIEIAKLLKLTSEQIPSSLTDKVVTLWKAGLLTGVKTQTGNTLSGAASLGLKKFSDIPAAALDNIAALFTGERSKALTFKGLASGGKEGVQKGYRYLKTGIDERGLGSDLAKFDAKKVNFGKSPLGRAAQAYTDTVFGLMGAADQPLYFASLRNNLADLAEVQAKNNGLRGEAKRAFTADFRKNPPADAFQLATDAAEKATFANDTLLSNAAGSIRKATEKSPVGNAVVNTLMPFTKVPSAVITRLFDYSPVGPVKLLAQALNKNSPKVTQRQLVEALAEAGTGTGAMYIGYQLAANGLMTGSYPEDANERALWELEGKKPNSIKVGNTWVSVNYTSPLGQVLGTGARAQEAVASGATGTDLAAQIGAGAGKTVVDQSFLQGVSGGLDALTDPERSAGKFIRNQTGSLVPTLAGDIAKAGDSKERQISTPLEAAKAKLPIPGIGRKSLTPKTNVLGEDIKRPSGPINTLINPFRPSDIPTPTDVSSEARRLQDAGFGVIVNDTKKYLQVGQGKEAIKVNLSPDELAKKNKEIGQAINSKWSEIIKTPEYKALTDADKKKALDSAETDIRAVNKKKLLEQKDPNASAQYELDKDQKKILDGGTIDSAKYAKATDDKSKGSSTDEDYYKSSDAEYKAKLADYQQKVKDNEYSKAGKVKASNELDKLKVGAKYSKDARDLYSLSKADLASYLRNEPSSAALGAEILAYDEALYNAGITKYRKFKNGFESTSKGGGKGRKGGGKGRKGGSKAKPWLPTSLPKADLASNVSSTRKLLTNAKVKSRSKKK